MFSINTSKFTSNKFADYAELPQAVYVPILDNAPPTVNNPITIGVKQVAIGEGDEVHGQFDNGADATITNLFFYLHNYKAYDCQFKRHV